MKIYDNSTVRRQDRLFEEENAFRLLREGEYGFLSLVRDNKGYGIPMSYVWDDADNIYFHCAPDGVKLECIEKNAEASFCVVGATNVLPSKFSTEYESVIASGRIVIIDDDLERMKALDLLVAKYSPEYKEIGKKYSEKSFHRTAILRLTIEKMSGKTKV